MSMEVLNEYEVAVQQLYDPLHGIIQENNKKQGRDSEIRDQLWDYLWRCQSWRLAVIDYMVENNVSIWIKGEPLGGKMLGARLRQNMLGLGAATAAREWAMMAQTLHAMEINGDHQLLLGSGVSFETYLDTKKPGGLTANRASPMRTWIREVVPQLEARQIDPERIVDRLEPSAMEAYIPLARNNREERNSKAGRKSAIESAGDPRLAQFITGLVLDGELKTSDDFRQLKSHPGIVKASPIMDALASADLDPVQVYNDLGLQKVDVLAHFLLGNGAFGDNKAKAIAELIDVARTYTVDQVRALQISRPGNEPAEAIPGETLAANLDLVMELGDSDGPAEMYRPVAAVPWSLAAWKAYEKAGGNIWVKSKRGEVVRVSLNRSDLPKPWEV